jgi:hypothetical protein
VERCYWVWCQARRPPLSGDFLHLKELFGRVARIAHGREFTHVTGPSQTGLNLRLGAEIREQMPPATQAQLLEAKGNQMPLTDDEAAAVDEGLDLYDALIDRLHDVPTPAGRTPHEIQQTDHSGSFVPLEDLGTPQAS